MSVIDEWSRGYARQADADFMAWERYQKHPSAVAAICHQMLFLQMACEKLCKAYVVKNGIKPPADVQTSHGFIEKHLPTIFRQEISYAKDDNLKEMRKVMKQLSYLAKEIEVLNPSMDKIARPDNCEYPWESAGEVISPLDWTFNPTILLTAQAGRTFLKMLRLAIDRILR